MKDRRFDRHMTDVAAADHLAEPGPFATVDPARNAAWIGWAIDDAGRRWTAPG